MPTKLDLKFAAMQEQYKSLEKSSGEVSMGLKELIRRFDGFERNIDQKLNDIKTDALMRQEEYNKSFLCKNDFNTFMKEQYKPLKRLVMSNRKYIWQSIAVVSTLLWMFNLIGKDFIKYILKI